MTAEISPDDTTASKNHTPPGDATCPTRWAALGVAHACSWISHEGGVHKCVCGDVWGHEPAAAVTAQGLAEQMTGDDKAIATAAAQLKADLPNYPTATHGFLNEIFAWLLSWTGLGPADDSDGLYTEVVKIARSYPEAGAGRDEELERLRAELAAVLRHDKEAVQQLNAAEADLRALVAAVGRVRHRHRPVEPNHPCGGPRCYWCRTEYPCAEIRALAAPKSNEENADG